MSGRPPPPCGQTDACENIILLQISFAGGKKIEETFKLLTENSWKITKSNLEIVTE